jgi:alpha-L-fucosidase
VPDWFHDAKLGIFIHWGLYSVPGWAPTTYELGDVIETGDWDAWFTNNAYAEWYLNSLRIKGSPTHKHHVETYGRDFQYDDFIPLFDEASRDWDPDDWAKLFKRAGAQYVIFVTKHHDGFLLWPSEHTAPSKQNYKAARDVVGDLRDSLLRHDIRLGLYYSHGLDWSFTDAPIRDFKELFTTIVQTPEFVEYVQNHWRELIERYQPSVMWGDIAYPVAGDPVRLFADYYNAVPDGVINDRFSQPGPVPERFSSDGVAPLPPPAHCDYTTPEYASHSSIVEKKWEETRGVGLSFGYNQNEGPEVCSSVREMVHHFVDVVSHNGNLLLGVGPMANGAISAIQRNRLEGLGAWLDVNGDAVFGTRPWKQAEAVTSDGVEVRFMQKAGALYATLLGTPTGRQVTVKGLRALGDTVVHQLGREGPLAWEQQGSDLTVTLADNAAESPALSLKITPVPDLAL